EEGGGERFAGGMRLSGDDDVSGSARVRVHVAQHERPIRGRLPERPNHTRLRVTGGTVRAARIQVVERVAFVEQAVVVGDVPGVGVGNVTYDNCLFDKGNA